MKKTNQNPITKNPLLKVIFNDNYKQRLSYNIKNNCVDFSKDFYTIATSEKLTELKLSVLISNAGYNFKDYLIQVYVSPINYSNKYYKGSAFTMDGSVILYNDWSNRKLVPENNFYRKSDFLKAIKTDTTKIILIQKRCYLKNDNYTNKNNYNPLFDRLLKSKIQYRYSATSYYLYNPQHNCYSYNNKNIDKSGFKIDEFKSVLNHRLYAYKQAKRQAEYNNIKKLNHLENTKKALKTMILNCLDRFLNKVKNDTLNKNDNYHSNYFLIRCLQNVEKLDNLTSIIDLKNYIKSIIRECKSF